VRTDERISPLKVLSILGVSVWVVHLAHGTSPDAEGTPASSMSSSDRTRIEKSLAEELQESVDRKRKLPGQRKIEISVSLSTGERRLQIDLGRDGVPAKAGAASEDQCSSLITEAMSILNGIISVNSYACTYGGNDIRFYHPEPALPHDQTGDRVASKGRVGP
jgi:hypothetical protein